MRNPINYEPVFSLLAILVTRLLAFPTVAYAQTPNPTSTTSSPPCPLTSVYDPYEAAAAGGGTADDIARRQAAIAKYGPSGVAPMGQESAAAPSAAQLEALSRAHAYAQACKRARENEPSDQARTVYLSYIAGTSLAADAQSVPAASEGRFQTPPGKNGWVYHGLGGPAARCSITMKMGRIHKTGEIGLLGNDQIELNATGTLIIRWGKDTEQYSIVMAKSGWNIPYKTQVQITLDTQPIDYSALTDTSTDSPAMAHMMMAGPIGDAFKSELADSNRLLTAAGIPDPTGRPPIAHQTIPMTLIAIRPDVIGGVVQNPEDFIKQVQALDSVHFTHGDEPNWIPVGSSEGIITAFKKCVADASAPTEAITTKPTQPY